jgi:hypothetical protein
MNIFVPEIHVHYFQIVEGTEIINFCPLLFIVTSPLVPMFVILLFTIQAFISSATSK